jgi:hypothetical protein
MRLAVPTTAGGELLIRWSMPGLSADPSAPVIVDPR